MGMQGITQVQRQVIGWFEVADKAAFSMENFPVFIFDDDQLGEYYGFPEFDNLPGMKIGKFYHLNEAALPDQLSRDITPADERVGYNTGAFPPGCLFYRFPWQSNAQRLAPFCLCSASLLSHNSPSAGPEGWHLQVSAHSKWPYAQGSGLHVHQLP